MVHECFNCRSQFRKSLKLHRLIAAAAKYLVLKPQKLLKIHLNFQLFQQFVTLRKNSLAASKTLG